MNGKIIGVQFGDTVTICSRGERPWLHPTEYICLYREQTRSTWTDWS